MRGVSTVSKEWLAVRWIAIHGSSCQSVRTVLITAVRMIHHITDIVNIQNVIGTQLMN